MKYFSLEKIKSIYKFFLFYVGFITIFLFFPLIFLLIKITNLFTTIRITEILTNRYGHLVLSPETYLLEKNAEKKHKPYLDFFYENNYGVCNNEVWNLWKKKIIIFPRFILAPIDMLLSKIYSKNNVHTIENFNDKLRDINCYSDKHEPSINLSQEQEKYCQDILFKNGIDIKKIRYACLFNRDHAYFNSFKYKKNWYYVSHHNYKIDQFTEAADFLNERDVYVFRMGAVVEEKFGEGKPKIIDYPNSGFRSELMDIYLAANCLFGIGSGTGNSHVSVLYRKPMLDLNANLHHLFTFMKDSILLAKHYYSKDKKRNLTLKEILDYNEPSIRHRHQLDNYKIDVIDCTKQEIKDATMELLDRIEGTYLETDEIKALQNEYKSKDWKKIKDTQSKEYELHNIIRANYSSDFLLNNKDWLS